MNTKYQCKFIDMIIVQKYITISTFHSLLQILCDPSPKLERRLIMSAGPECHPSQQFNCTTHIIQSPEYDKLLAFRFSFPQPRDTYFSMFQRGSDD